MHQVVFEDQLNPIDPTEYGDQVKILPYSQVIHLGKISIKNDAQPPTSSDTAIIMYTSGSTGIIRNGVLEKKICFILNAFFSLAGPPKGVVLCHQNIVNEIVGVSNSVSTRKDDIYLAFLPLAHVIEQAVENWLCLGCGIPIGYSSPHTLTDRSTKIKEGHRGDASVLRPSVMATVPLVLERIWKNIQEKIESGPPIKRLIFYFALQYKLHWTEKGYDTPIINAQGFFFFNYKTR